MVTTLNYGLYSDENFALIAHEIANTIAVSSHNGAEHITRIINNNFFGGQALSPKSFGNILSINSPIIWYPIRNYVKIDSEPNFFNTIGYIEGIPYLGSFIAILMSFGHLVEMNLARRDLRNAVSSLNYTNPNDESYRDKVKAVVENALYYTTEKNALVGSLLAIIPFVKPIVRIGQGISYHLISTINHISAKLRPQHR